MVRHDVSIKLGERRTIHHLSHHKANHAMIERILGYIEDYQVKKAFWAAAKNVEHDEAKQELFLQIIFFCFCYSQSPQLI